MQELEDIYATVLWQFKDYVYWYIYNNFSLTIIIYTDAAARNVKVMT